MPEPAVQNLGVLRGLVNALTARDVSRTPDVDFSRAELVHDIGQAGWTSIQGSWVRQSANGPLINDVGWGSPVMVMVEADDGIASPIPALDGTTETETKNPRFPPRLSNKRLESLHVEFQAGLAADVFLFTLWAWYPSYLDAGTVVRRYSQFFRLVSQDVTLIDFPCPVDFVSGVIPVIGVGGTDGGVNQTVLVEAEFSWTPQNVQLPPASGARPLMVSNVDTTAARPANDKALAPPVPGGR